MVTGSLIRDNRRVGAQLGPGPLCCSVMGQPQLERSRRQGPGALEDGEGHRAGPVLEEMEEQMTALQKAI